jgi:hypothetical protein
MKKPSDDSMPKREVAKREARVLGHFLTSKPEPHKPLGKTAQSKRHRKEKRNK